MYAGFVYHGKHKISRYSFKVFNDDREIENLFKCPLLLISPAGRSITSDLHRSSAQPAPLDTCCTFFYFCSSLGIPLRPPGRAKAWCGILKEGGGIWLASYGCYLRLKITVLCWWMVEHIQNQWNGAIPQIVEFSGGHCASQTHTLILILTLFTLALNVSATAGMFAKRPYWTNTHAVRGNVNESGCN